MHIKEPAPCKSRKLFIGIPMIPLMVMLLAGCWGKTLSAINVTMTSARLMAMGTCGFGDTVCSYFFRYRLLGGDWVKTPVRTIGAVANHAITEDVTGLTPHVTYEYQICGIGNKNNSSWICQGSNGDTVSVSRFVTGVFGIDSNQVGGHPGAGDGTNLSIDKAVSAGVHWVARYIDGANSPITLAEVRSWHHSNIRVAFIWESDRYRSCAAVSLAEEFRMGAADGAAARNYMNLSLQAPASAAVYFTVDFHISPAAWDENQVVRPADGSPGCNPALGTRRLIEAYFDGLRSTFASGRIGVYGSYATVRGLLDASRAAYAWQQAFLGGPIESRATLLQFDIFAPQDGWLVTPGPGALDLDVSIGGFASMW